MNIGEYEHEDNNDKQHRGRQTKRRIVPRLVGILSTILRLSTLWSISVIFIVIIIMSLLFLESDGVSTAMKIGMGYLLVMKPLLSTLDVILFDIGHISNSDGNSRRRINNLVTQTTRMIALSFLLSIVCNQFPKSLSVLVACIALFVFGLASRQVALQSAASTSNNTEDLKDRNNTLADCDDDCTNTNNNPISRIWNHLGIKERAVVAAIILAIVMLFENFMIWVVSATYPPGMNTSTAKPLQDNGRIVLEKLAMKLFNVQSPSMARQSLQTLRDGLNVQWALVTSFGTSLICLEMRLGQSTTIQQQQQHQQQRTLHGLTLRVLITLAMARFIRTISFSLTVLPSQVNNCYVSHFPPPPENWSEWLMVGFLPNSRGGCNDLILSGHATVTSTITCAFTSVAASTPFSLAVWTLVTLDYSIEAYQGLHYSVDMWLGCIITCLLWKLTKPFEFKNGGDENVGVLIPQPLPQGNVDARRADAMTRMPLESTRIIPFDDMKLVGIYALPAMVAYVALIVVPEAFINYFLVGYSVLAGIIFSRCGFTSFLQHVLLCEVTIAIGAYL
jgi:hypothetical protein